MMIMMILSFLNCIVLGVDTHADILNDHSQLINNIE